jgi:3-hydroxyacyl-[acyl-carrier-protein] dehydratase
MASSHDRIEALKGGAGTLNRRALVDVLGYGDDYLFLDSVEELTLSKCRATYAVSANSPFVRSHFRDAPVMPGALIAESVGQAGALLVRYARDIDDRKLVLLARLTDATFDSAALPGDVLEVFAELVTANRFAATVAGSARVAGRGVMHARFMLIVTDRESLLAPQVVPQCS